MASWNTRKQLIAIGSGSFAICALAVAGVYYAEGLIEEVEAQIAQKKELIAIAEAKIEKIPSIEKEVIILRENLQEYVKILPDTKELTNFRKLDTFGGYHQDRKTRRLCPITIGAYIIEDKLLIKWEHNKNLHTIETMQRLGQRTKEVLTWFVDDYRTRGGKAAS